MANETGIGSATPERVFGENATSEGLSRPGMNWEAFYRNYRTPGYVPGYEILNRLGSGVFGVVFKARKPSIGKFYAIKFLKVDDDSVKEAVRREVESVRIFAQIDHPNLVSIEDLGEVDGIPFIVMGYAGEETLRTRLEGGPLPPEEALRIFTQVCRGVDALHERGLAHFDLKPANVFLKGDAARVGDYGLSKLISESRQTLSFGRGTPYYMAPEMLHRHGDHRSDIYSLGCLFYEMLTKEVPFRGETEWEVLKRHETEAVSFPAGFPGRFRPVIERCMAKDPARRYASAGALLADLGASPTVEGNARGAAASPTTEAPPVSSGSRPGMEFKDRVEVFVNDLRSIRSRTHGAAPAGPFPAAPAAARGALGGIEAFLFAIASVLRAVATALGRLLETLVTVPFRLIGVAVKIAVFALGVGVAFWVGELLIRIFVRVFRGMFGGLG